MQSRIYTFLAGVQQSAAPDPGTPAAAADIVPFSYLSANFANRRLITNTWALPYSVVAGTSIAHGMTSIYQECLMYLKSNGGAVTSTANPRIAAGTADGQRLVLMFTDSVNTVLLQDGNGLSMPNGNVRSLQGTVLEFVWDNGQSTWRCLYWNNVGDIL